MAELTAKQQALFKQYESAIEHLIGFNGIKEMPKMGNMTPARLVDIVGNLKVVEKDAKKTIDLLNGIIDSKIEEGETEVKGENYTMKLVEVEQMRLNGDLAKATIKNLVKRLGEFYPDFDEAKANQLIADCHLPLYMTQHKYS